MVFLVADERRLVRHVLGLLRLELGRPPVNEGGLHYLWVVDFPLFQGFGADGSPLPAHHPFTMPHPDDLELLASRGKALLDVRSQAYDLVLNGWELGSGSVRIHRQDIQNQVFACLGIEPDEAQRKFGFLLDAFGYGAPPHAGFAFGIDRLTALLAGEANIREVIAFPKTQSGADPLTSAPSPIDSAHLARAGPACPAVSGDLFSEAAREHLKSRSPLAARLRPRNLDDVVGQEHLAGSWSSVTGFDRD